MGSIALQRCLWPKINSKTALECLIGIIIDRPMLSVLSRSMIHCIVQGNETNLLNIIISFLTILIRHRPFGRPAAAQRLFSAIATLPYEINSFHDCDIALILFSAITTCIDRAQDGARDIKVFLSSFLSVIANEQQFTRMRQTILSALDIRNPELIDLEPIRIINSTSSLCDLLSSRAFFKPRSAHRSPDDRKRARLEAIEAAKQALQEKQKKSESELPEAEDQIESLNKIEADVKSGLQLESVRQEAQESVKVRFKKYFQEDYNPSLWYIKAAGKPEDSRDPPETINRLIGCLPGIWCGSVKDRAMKLAFCFQALTELIARLPEPLEKPVILFWPALMCASHSHSRLRATSLQLLSAIERYAATVAGIEIESTKDTPGITESVGIFQNKLGVKFSRFHEALSVSLIKGLTEFETKDVALQLVHQLREKTAASTYEFLMLAFDDEFNPGTLFEGVQEADAQWYMGFLSHAFLHRACLGRTAVIGKALMAGARKFGSAALGAGIRNRVLDKCRKMLDSEAPIESIQIAAEVASVLMSFPPPENDKKDTVWAELLPRLDEDTIKIMLNTALPALAAFEPQTKE